MLHSPKSWWAPVWRGLVVDPDGKHVRRLGTALALHLYLIIHADRPSGRLVRKHATVARDMGVPIRTVRAWMGKLRSHGYIRTTRTGHALVIDILNWRPVGAHSGDRDHSGRAIVITPIGGS